MFHVQLHVPKNSTVLLFDAAENCYVHVRTRKFGATETEFARRQLMLADGGTRTVFQFHFPVTQPVTILIPTDHTQQRKTTGLLIDSH